MRLSSHLGVIEAEEGVCQSRGVNGGFEVIMRGCCLITFASARPRRDFSRSRVEGKGIDQ
jgi:hypothetical protein